MRKRIQLSALAIIAVGGLATAAIAMQHTTAPREHACLAIGQGVCFSGTTQWVARAAETMPQRGVIMLAMAGDAF